MTRARTRKEETAGPVRGADELRQAKKLVEDYIHRTIAVKRRLDQEFVKVNKAFMTRRLEKTARDNLAGWARKEAGEKVLRTVKVSDEEFQVETTGEGLGRLRYTLKSGEGKLLIDAIHRQCDFCMGKGICPHCDMKGCQVCSRTGKCFVCEGQIWETYSR